MNFKRIDNYIGRYKISDLVEYVEQLNEAEQQTAKTYLLERLKEVSNHRERDAIAMALGDLQCQDAVEILVELIFREDLKKHRGSLVSALENLDCSKYYQKLVPLMFAEKNFEVRMNMYWVMESMFPELNDEERKWCMDYVEEQMEEYECMLQQVYDVYEGVMGGILDEED